MVDRYDLREVHQRLSETGRQGLEKNHTRQRRGLEVSSGEKARERGGTAISGKGEMCEEERIRYRVSIERTSLGYLVVLHNTRTNKCKRGSEGKRVEM